MSVNDVFKIKKNAVGIPPGSLEYTGIYKDEKIEIDVIEYNKDEFKRYQIDSFLDLKVVETNNYWINVVGLHKEEIIYQVGNKFEIHHMDLEDIVQVFQRSKIDINEKYLFSVMKMIYIRNNEIIREHTSIFVKDNVLITLQEKKGDVFDNLRDRIESRRGQVRSRDITYLYYLILDTLVDSFVIVTHKLEQDLQKIESEQLLQDEVNVNHLYTLKKELLYFDRVIDITKGIVSSFIKNESKYFTNRLRPYYLDLLEHLLQIDEYLKSFGEITDNLYDIQMARVTNETNETVMTLTIFSAIFIPLSFLAGVFGMNFTHFPGMDYKYSLYIFIIICIVIALGMLRYFSKKK